MEVTTDSDLLAPPEGLKARVLEAAIRCFGRWGLAKTTVDDIAREADCGRASVYRLFPGGKDHLLVAAGQYEEGRFFAELRPHLEAAEDLDELLVVGIGRASRFLREHEALQYLLAHEPEAILPHLAFDRIGPLLHRATGYVAPYLERFVAPADVPLVAEWAVRLIVSYTISPSEHVDLTDPDDAHRFVSTYLAPGLHATDSKGE